MNTVFIISAVILTVSIIASFIINLRVSTSKSARLMLAFRSALALAGLAVFILSWLMINIRSAALPDRDWIIDSFKAYIIVIFPIFTAACVIILAAALTKHKWTLIRLILSHVFAVALVVISIIFAQLTGRGYMPYYYIRLAGTGIGALSFITLIPDSIRLLACMKKAEKDSN